MKKNIIVIGNASTLTLGIRGPKIEYIYNRVRPSIKFISAKTAQEKAMVLIIKN